MNMIELVWTIMHKHAQACQACTNMHKHAQAAAASPRPFLGAQHEVQRTLLAPSGTSTILHAPPGDSVIFCLGLCC